MKTHCFSAEYAWKFGLFCKVQIIPVKALDGVVTMAVRLAVLATLFCVGCSTALPDSAPVKEKEAGPQAASKEKPAAKKETAEIPAASPKEKEAAARGKRRRGKEKEEEVKGHVTVQCVPAQKRALSVTVDSLGRTELLPENLGSLTATVEGHVHGCSSAWEIRSKRNSRSSNSIRRSPGPPWRRKWPPSTV